MDQEKYFGVKLEFDKQKVDSLINETIMSGEKGYVCSIEGNILANTYSNPIYLDVINNSLVNICDGSSIAFFASLFYFRNYGTYIGADLFLEYIKNKKYRNTVDVLDGLRSNLIKINPKIEGMRFEPLPFERVENFDYKTIAEMINIDNPDVIWVSLGAPKQEEFMSRLLPFINRGVMFGFGAIFDFNAGVNDLKRAPKYFLALKIEWLYRFLKEPKKQGKRIVNILNTFPKLVLSEFRKRLSSLIFSKPR